MYEGKGLMIICLYILCTVHVVMPCREVDLFEGHGKQNLTCLQTNYLNLTDVQTVEICARLCLTDKKCLIANFMAGTGLCFLGDAKCAVAEYVPGFEMLLVHVGDRGPTGDFCVSWQGPGSIYSGNTVRYTGASGVEEIARWEDGDGDIFPGYRSVNDNRVYFIIDNRWRAAGIVYGILVIHTSCTVTWRPLGVSEQIPKGAVVGGSFNDHKLYVARTTVKVNGEPKYVAGYSDSNPLGSKIVYRSHPTDAHNITSNDNMEVLIVI